MASFGGASSAEFLLDGIFPPEPLGFLEVFSLFHLPFLFSSPLKSSKKRSFQPKNLIINNLHYLYIERSC